MENRKRFACIILCLCLLLGGMVSGSAEATGRWLKTSDGWMYLKGTVIATGWEQIDGIWYWFDESGFMANGWKEIDGTWYYFDNGAMVTGTHKIKGKKYVFSDSGAWIEHPEEASASGWKQTGNDWVYFDNGTKATGWKQIDGTWYYFSGEGIMQTGWLELEGKWYWLAENGAMATGTVEIDGQQYVFGADGAWVERDELTLLSAPWHGTFDEVKAVMPEGINLNTPSSAWKMWWKQEDFLFTGGTSYHDPLGFYSNCYPGTSNEEPFLYCGIPVQSVRYYFLFTTDETGKPVYDTDHSTLICAEMTFENAEDKQQQRETLVRELTALYGAPDETVERTTYDDITLRMEHWTGKNGTHMSIFTSSLNDFHLRFAIDGMDEMLEAASQAEYAATHAPADGELRISDGSALKLDRFTLTPEAGMRYVIAVPGEDDHSIDARLCAAVAIFEDDEFTGDQMEVYKGSFYTPVSSVLTQMQKSVEETGYTVLADESFFEKAEISTSFGAKQCMFLGDSAIVFTIPEKEGKYALYSRIIEDPQWHYFFVIWSPDYSTLDTLQETFRKTVSWD